MQNDDIQLQKRFKELSYRAKLQQRTIFSDFLTIDEQSILNETALESSVFLYGGYEFAERRAAGFGSESDDEKAKAFAGVWVKLYPIAPKFADELSHRDFLGTLMGLGIRRETIGDIIIGDNCGYIFCEKKIADYILENVDRVKRTSVKCETAQCPPESSIKMPDSTVLIVPSERIDAVVAAVYKLSRADSQELFAQKRVFINGRGTLNSSYMLKNGEIISVRHFGRFIFCGVSGETKKSRLKIEVRIF